MGSGGPSTKNLLWSWDTLREKTAKRVGPYGPAHHVEHQLRDPRDTVQD